MTPKVSTVFSLEEDGAPKPFQMNEITADKNKTEYAYHAHASVYPILSTTLKAGTSLAALHTRIRANNPLGF